MGVPPALLGNYDKLTGQPTDNPKSCFYSQSQILFPNLSQKSQIPAFQFWICRKLAGCPPNICQVRRIQLEGRDLVFGNWIWEGNLGLGNSGNSSSGRVGRGNRVGKEGAKCTISRFLSNVSRFLMIVFCFLTTLYQYRKNVSQYFSIILFSNT